MLYTWPPRQLPQGVSSKAGLDSVAEFSIAVNVLTEFVPKIQQSQQAPQRVA